MLDKLLKINDIDHIIINTDAVDILKKDKIFENKKISLRHRRKEICGDLVSMNTIIKDDLDNLNYDYYLMTHTTNPLLNIETLIKAIDKFKCAINENLADSLFSVTRIQERIYDKNLKPKNHDPSQLIRTQDLDPLYIENSNFYIFSKNSFYNNNNRIGKNPIIIETNHLESIDIDTEDEWNYAEIISQINI